MVNTDDSQSDELSPKMIEKLDVCCCCLLILNFGRKKNSSWWIEVHYYCTSTTLTNDGLPEGLLEIC